MTLAWPTIVIKIMITLHPSQQTLTCRLLRSSMQIRLLFNAVLWHTVRRRRIDTVVSIPEIIPRRSRLSLRVRPGCLPPSLPQRVLRGHRIAAVGVGVGVARFVAGSRGRDERSLSRSQRQLREVGSVGDGFVLDSGWWWVVGLLMTAEGGGKRQGQSSTSGIKTFSIKTDDTSTDSHIKHIAGQY